jgi:serine/threonine protein kinase
MVIPGALRITDFGLARIKARGAGDHTAMMTQCGTPYWTAPEILKGEVSVEPSGRHKCLRLVLTIPQIQCYSI